jgi:hypothetical protein
MANATAGEEDIATGGDVKTSTGSWRGVIWEIAKYCLPLVLAGGALLLFYYFDKRPPAYGDVPLQWNRAIERLGFEPVYPPQEGIEVGDVFIRVAPPDKSNDVIPVDYYNDAFTGRSIKIAHIDLTQSILDGEPTVIIPDTRFKDNGDMASDQPGQANYLAASARTAGMIKLSEVGFPSVKLSNTIEANSFLDWLGLGLGQDESSTITFSNVQTYAASPVAAAVALELFCREPGDVCTNDAHARKLFAKSLDASINCAYKNSYVFNIDIFVVTQIFTARSIAVTTNSSHSNELFFGDSADPKTAKARVSNAMSSGLEMNSKFEGAPVFAYKRVANRMPKGKPEGDFCRGKG